MTATKSCVCVRVIVESCKPDSARAWPVKNWLALQADLILVIGQHRQLIKYVCMSRSAVLQRANVLYFGPPALRSVTGLEEDVAWVLTKKYYLSLGLTDQWKSRKIVKGK